MFILSLSDSTNAFVNSINTYIDHGVSFLRFIISLPTIFTTWFVSLPPFYMVGFSVILLSVVIVILLKFKTFVLF